MRGSLTGPQSLNNSLRKQVFKNVQNGFWPEKFCPILYKTRNSVCPKMSQNPDLRWPTFLPCPPHPPPLNPPTETWPSGRRRSPAKGVGPEGSRGFESLRLRHPPFSFSFVGTHSTPYGTVFVDLTAFIVAFHFSSIRLISIHCVVEIVVFLEIA